jgi:hypothetical protein
MIRVMASAKLFSILILTAAVLTACSLYQSDGREAIEKNTGGFVTGSGVSFIPKTHYECLTLMAVPTDWQDSTTSLDEYITLPGAKAILLDENTSPQVVVYTWTERHVEACQLTIIDAKLSSQNLNDIVAFGESLIARR